nr:hypothetical protein [Tanacetum cinerariifolium]
MSQVPKGLIQVVVPEDELKRTKTAQQTKIDGLERRVKKLEKKQRLRTHKLKRLYKVSLTARVISSSDDKSLGEEDASKHERIINDLDVDEDITLVNDQEIFDADKDRARSGTNLKMAKLLSFKLYVSKFWDLSFVKF